MRFHHQSLIYRWYDTSCGERAALPQISHTSSAAAHHTLPIDSHVSTASQALPFKPPWPARKRFSKVLRIIGGLERLLHGDPVSFDLFCQ